MPANKLSMRKIKEILRLKFEAGQGQRQIARSCGVDKTSVAECLARFRRSGLSWPQAGQLDSAMLEHTLYPPAPAAGADRRPLPHWPTVHRELRRKGATLTLLWHEYKSAHPHGLQYSRFCDRYRAWAAKLDLVMRQSDSASHSRIRIEELRA